MTPILQKSVGMPDSNAVSFYVQCLRHEEPTQRNDHKGKRISATTLSSDALSDYNLLEVSEDE